MARLVLAAAIALGALGPALADTSADRETINRQAQQDFVAERFDLLEETASSYLETKAVNTDGGRRLASFYQGLRDAVAPASPAEAEDAVERARGVLQRWLKAYPRSKPARIMRAHVAINHAWIARGTGVAQSVSRAQWELFGLRMQAAQSFLEDARPVASDDPHWHSIAVTIARVFGLPDEEFGAIAAKALDVDPAYTFTHDEILVRMEPQWGGDWESYRAAVDDIVSRTERERGQSFYALGYARLGSRYKHQFFAKTGVDWARFKKGYENLTSQYPSPRNLNAFGAFACLNGDQEALFAAVERIGTKLDERYWTNGAPMKLCVASVDKAAKAEERAHFSKPRPRAAEIVERTRLRDAAGEDFVAGNFDSLETTYARLLASKDRTESGDWKLEHFYNGFTSNALTLPEGARAGQPVFDKAEEQAAKWLAAQPNSRAATIAAARISLTRAQHLFRDDYTATATDSRNIEAFRLLVKARNQLETIRAAASEDPEWWATKLAIERDDRASEQTLDALAGEALRREPTYGRTLTEILQRRSIRRQNEFDGFVQTILALGPPEALPELYARSYLWLAQVWRLDTLVDVTRPKWPILKSGLDLIVSRWPSDWNLNRYANLACLAKDRSAARLVMARIDGRVVEDVWNSWRSPKACLEQSAKAAD